MADVQATANANASVTVHIHQLDYLLLSIIVIAAVIIVVGFLYYLHKRDLAVPNQHQATSARGIVDQNPFPTGINPPGSSACDRMRRNLVE